MTAAAALRPAALLAPLLLAGCGLVQFTSDEDGKKTVEVKAGGAVVVETFNGSVEVSGGSAGAVEVSWTKRGSSSTSQEAAKADLANVEVKVEAKGSAVHVVARRTDGRSAGWSGVSFVVVVPRGTPTTLESDNGSLTVRGVGAAVRAKTSNGRVEVARGTGALDLSSSNGSLEASGAGVVLSARTSNGAVRFDGSLADGAHRAETKNGSIEVTLPRAARFSVVARTSNGHVESEFALGNAGSRARRLEGSVGENPQASLALETSNGTIRIRRGS